MVPFILYLYMSNFPSSLKNNLPEKHAIKVYTYIFYFIIKTQTWQSQNQGLN